MAVQKETLRQNVYTTIRNLLIANKPSYTYNGTTYSFTIIAEYGRESASFPYIVLNPALVELELLNIDGSGEDYLVNIQLDLYSLELHRKITVDIAMDSIMNTIIDNQSSLKSNNLLLMADPFDESNTTPFEDNNQVLNTKSIIIKMKLQ